MSDCKNTTGLVTAFNSYLKEHKLRETYERKVVIQALSQCQGYFDAGSLAKIISSGGERVSKATLYNTISLLVKAGLVRRQQFADGQHIYECTLRMPSGNQSYLICNECGKITDLRSSTVTKMLDEMKFGSFSPEYISMSVYGTCARCTRRIRREASGKRKK